MRTTAVALTVALSAFTAIAAEESYLQFGPMLGHVGPTEARIWAKLSGGGKLGVRIGEKDDLSDAREIPGRTFPPEADYMGTVTVGDLKPVTRYVYTLTIDDKPVIPRPYPAFTTAPADGTKGKVRIAFGSCTGRDARSAAATWGELSAMAIPVDLMLMLGDNHYADSTEPAVQRIAYYKQRSPAGYREFTRRVPSYAIWDDHDYGPNDSDGTAKGKEISVQTFQQFWGNPSYGQADDPGVYFKFSRGDIDFFMLDTRYHRTPNKDVDEGQKTMLGAKQLEWLKRELKASKSTIKFITSGGEFQTNGSKDSWTSFDRERKLLWSFIEENSISGVVLLSGDRHFTGAYQVQGKWIEVTSGPLGSKNFPTKNLPEMFLNYGEGKLFCVFDVDTTGPTPALALEVHRAGEGLLEKRAFTWDEITGKTKIPPLPPSPPTPPKPKP